MIAFVNNYVTVQHRNLILAPGRSAFPLLKLILRDRIARTKPAVNPPQFPWASVGQSLPFSHRPFPSVRNLDISGNEVLYRDYVGTSLICMKLPTNWHISYEDGATNSCMLPL